MLKVKKGKNNRTKRSIEDSHLKTPLSNELFSVFHIFLRDTSFITSFTSEFPEIANDLPDPF